MTARTAREVVHSCCPSARIALHARRVRSSDVSDDTNVIEYRWYVGRVAECIVIFCPWCAVHLELDRRAHAIPNPNPPVDIRTRRKP